MGNKLHQMQLVDGKHPIAFILAQNALGSRRKINVLIYNRQKNI